MAEELTEEIEERQKIVSELLADDSEEEQEVEKEV